MNSTNKQSMPASNMRIPNELPILVTLRSAEEMRDAGIRFAYLRAGMFVSLFIVLIMVACFVYLTEGSSRQIVPLAGLFMGLVFAAVVTIGMCTRAMEFPQYPRLEREELDAMQNQMGIPAHVFRQTHDNVVMAE